MFHVEHVYRSSHAHTSHVRMPSRRRKSDTRTSLEELWQSCLKTAKGHEVLHFAVLSLHLRYVHARIYGETELWCETGEKMQKRKRPRYDPRPLRIPYSGRKGLRPTYRARGSR